MIVLKLGKLDIPVLTFKDIGRQGTLEDIVLVKSIVQLQCGVFLLVAGALLKHVI